MSSYTHVELAIGEVPGSNGMMANVARIFNDSTGVELCERTGRNPQYTYLSLGCSKNAEQRMLKFTREQVGKPFDNMAMARSLFYPRTTNGNTYYCAELVASILRQGGLLSSDSNPGAATPHSLYKLYSKQAAVTANPFTLRQASNVLNLNSVVSQPKNHNDAQPLLGAPNLGGIRGTASSIRNSRYLTGGNARRRSDSPPRASFKVLASAGHAHSSPGITLTLSSLRS